MFFAPGGLPRPRFEGVALLDVGVSASTLSRTSASSPFKISFARAPLPSQSSESSTSARLRALFRFADRSACLVPEGVFATPFLLGVAKSVFPLGLGVVVPLVFAENFFEGVPLVLCGGVSCSDSDSVSSITAAAFADALRTRFEGVPTSTVSLSGLARFAMIYRCCHQPDHQLQSALLSLLHKRGRRVVFGELL